MEIELDGTGFAILGEHHAVCEAVRAALLSNGGRQLAEPDEAEILLCSCPLLPDQAADDNQLPLLAAARSCATAMKMRGGGRIVFILSALAGTPARRYPELSIRAAGQFAGLRTLAMAFGPQVLVNAVGIGTVDAGGIVSGDPAFLGHVPLGRAGTAAEAAAAVLFFCDPLNTYTSGQLLCVDGGWAAGYGRNF